MAYQKIELPSGDAIGNPGALPAELVGLADTSLADLNWTDPSLGFHGFGFVPVADPDPEPAQRWIHKAIFIQRIAAANRIAIRAAAKTDPLIEDFLDVLYATDLVNLDNAETQAGVAYLVSENLLTAGEAEALLA